MVEIKVARKLLEANDKIAALNREEFAHRKLLVINVMGSPGAGKTSLLEKIGRMMKERCRLGVIEGDLETSRDAERIDAAGMEAVQITTGRACHLDAGMVRDALQSFDACALDLLFVENVGNLVCPAGFDLGEDARILVASSSEGDDKPAKYPPMFSKADLLAVNKIDLLPHVDFDLERFVAEAKRLNPSLEVFPVSCRTGEGIEALVEKLIGLAQAKRAKQSRAC